MNYIMSWRCARRPVRVRSKPYSEINLRARRLCGRFGFKVCCALIWYVFTYDQQQLDLEIRTTPPPGAGTRFTDSFGCEECPRWYPTLPQGSKRGIQGAHRRATKGESSNDAHILQPTDERSFRRLKAQKTLLELERFWCCKE